MTAMTEEEGTAYRLAYAERMAKHFCKGFDDWARHAGLTPGRYLLKFGDGLPFILEVTQGWLDELAKGKSDD